MTVNQTRLNDPGYWRERAEEAHTVADQMMDANAQNTMRRIAAGYEEMAARVERLKILTKVER